MTIRVICHRHQLRSWKRRDCRGRPSFENPLHKLSTKTWSYGSTFTYVRFSPVSHKSYLTFFIVPPPKQQLKMANAIALTSSKSLLSESRASVDPQILLNIQPLDAEHGFECRFVRCRMLNSFHIPQALHGSLLDRGHKSLPRGQETSSCSCSSLWTRMKSSLGYQSAQKKKEYHQ